ncbi:zinc finger, CCHC-type containing protein [Tanacetum coccineum]|uniref:Zinc finger, CCHC-type containing protein n=1 Tax=Tanacetum coccineum TaxID=301880 RepID=A0ABQ5IWK4_9ASTR
MDLQEEDESRWHHCQAQSKIGTRPDLAYAVSRLSRYTSNPSYAHWKAITRVLHYLRYSRDYGLHYDRHPAVIEGYSDANWISDIKDSRSTSGYVFTLGGAAISWKSSKQTVIAKSTMESEFIALDKCGEEAEWLRQFVEDIPRWPKPVTAISIHCDSKSAMGRAKSTMYNGKSRHIRRRHNSIRQLLSTGVISIDYVASKDNIADPFTKGLSRELVSKYVRSGCTTALNVVPWETDGESVLREACPTRCTCFPTVNATYPTNFTVVKATLNEFPGLLGQSVSYAILEFPAGSLNPLHIHPRSAELLFVIHSSLHVGFVDTKNTLFNQTLETGDMFVFPKGLVHFQYNSNNTEPALAVSAFGSASAGTQSIANSVFNSTIYEGVLAESFNTGSDVIEHIESGLKG